jgi:hypothetical protein
MNRAIFLILLAVVAKATALDDRPKMIRVTVQVIEVRHAMLAKWTSAAKLKGREIHDSAVELAATGAAEIVETNVLICRSGEKALVESVGEWIYPTEYEPPGEIGLPLKPVDDKARFARPLRPSDFISFETRNAGTVVEIEPTLSQGDKLVDLRISFDIVKRASLETWMEFRDEWGESSVKRPIFDSWRLSTGATLTAGNFELVNVYSPKPVAVPAAATRQLVFIRADVLTVGR